MEWGRGSYGEPSFLQELEALGLDCILSEGQLDVVKLLNGLHGLLQLHQSTLGKLEEVISK